MIREYITQKYQRGQDEEARRSIILELKQAQITEPDTESDQDATISDIPEPTEAEVAAAQAEYYASLRAYAYGSPAAQMEFITEHGLEAWQTRVAEIKAQYPKPAQE